MSLWLLSGRNDDRTVMDARQPSHILRSAPMLCFLLFCFEYTYTYRNMGCHCGLLLRKTSFSSQNFHGSQKRKILKSLFMLNVFGTNQNWIVNEANSNLAKKHNALSFYHLYFYFPFSAIFKTYTLEHNQPNKSCFANEHCGTNFRYFLFTL